MKLWHRLALFGVAAGLIFSCAPAYAMHIPDGAFVDSWTTRILLASGFALTVPIVLYGLYRLKKISTQQPETKALVSLIGAGVFVISCVPFPIPLAGSCSHPCGTGLAAILIGPSLTVVVSSVALALQALFLQHGGFTTLGLNTLSMGVAGAFSGYAIFKVVKRLSGSALAAAFLAGLLSDWATYGVTSLVLAIGAHGEKTIPQMTLAYVVAFSYTQIPLGLFEGFLSMGAYYFIRSRRPELLTTLLQRSPA